ncbi:MAG: bifunctional hydroxymethylpyrimidine kinase/phosphomethylpyrimidine kinase [Rikenellaceae bacterium]
MQSNKILLTVAGSDSSGGAGIQVDTKSALRLGCESATVITALTAQNPSEVRLVELVSTDMIEAQFRAVADFMNIGAVKIGMVGDAERVRLVARLIKEYNLKNVVVDPVLAATSGGKLAREGVVEAIKEHLFPIATLLTPNQDEAEELCGMKRGGINSESEAHRAWEILSLQGVSALLLKGGHAAKWQERGVIVDRLYSSAGVREYCAKRLDIEELQTHGTGCMVSSATAALLAQGVDLSEAVARAIVYVQGVISSARF